MYMKDEETNKKRKTTKTRIKNKQKNGKPR